MPFHRRIPIHHLNPAMGRPALLHGLGGHTFHMHICAPVKARIDFKMQMRSLQTLLRVAIRRDRTQDVKSDVKPEQINCELYLANIWAIDIVTVMQTTNSLAKPIVTDKRKKCYYYSGYNKSIGLTETDHSFVNNTPIK